MTSSQITNVREFNRSYTQRIGLLDDSFLGTGRPLGPSRLLYEIGRGHVVVADLRGLLGLDSGYLSRLLRRLEREGLVTVEPDPRDGRRRVVSLTDRGDAEWAELDRRSDEVAGDLLGPLSDSQRQQLCAALTTAHRLIRAASLEFETVDPSTRAATASMSHYFDELDRRFPGGFDRGDALAGDAPAFRPPGGAFVLATTQGDVVGCGGVQQLDAAGEIKRMWIDPDLRGFGIGKRLLEHLESVCRDLGHLTVRLDTNSELIEAIAMYEAAGYTPIERYNDNPYARRWFEKQLRR